MSQLLSTRTAMALACAGVALAAFVLALAAGRGSHFNPDESRWISRAHYLADLADPGGPTWDDQYMTRGQPPLGSYVMGLGLLLQGRDLDTNPPWDFTLPWEVNVAIGNKPVAADLAAGRATSAFLTALTALVIVAVAHTFVPRLWAIAAGAIYGIHPFTVYIGSIAMADALFGFLIACAAWAAAALGRRPTRLRAMVLGALLGLGAAAKLSPLAVAAGLTLGILVNVAVLAVRQRGWPPEQKRWAGLGLLVGAAALAVFVAVYPYLWPDPFVRTRNLFAFRTQEMVAQASDWPVMAVPNRLEALRRLHVNFGERYNVTASVMTLVGLPTPPSWVRTIEIVIVVAGVAVLSVRSARAGLHSPQTLALAVLGGHVLVTILGMRSEFDRYHLPMAILGPIAAVAALQSMTSQAISRCHGIAAVASTRPASLANGGTVAGAASWRARDMASGQRTRQ